MNHLPFYLAHGAGAGHNNTFLSALRDALSKQIQQEVKPVTFSYMKEVEQTGKRRPPPRFPTLIPEFSNYIENEDACIVAGKSMGGRVAAQLSDLPMVKGIVCFGFPFYPQGKSEKHRLAFLENLQVPCLIIQGTRDQLGSYEWVSQQKLPETVSLIWIEGADHDFKTLKKYKKDELEIVTEIASMTRSWLNKII